jgi:phosphoglycolate phosphatase
MEAEPTLPRYSLVVFDWDGTLVDSAAHIVYSIQASARDLTLPVPSDRQARHIIGLGLHDALETLFPGLPARQYPEVAERYRYHYVSGEAVVCLFDGVREALTELKGRGHLLAVATGKSRRGLDRALASTGLGSLIHGSRCADEGFPKPHPDMLLRLLDAFGVAPEDAVMVGDTTHDLEMARAAGVDAVAVTYGAHEPEDLARAGPAACLDSPQALWKWLRSNA